MILLVLDVRKGENSMIRIKPKYNLNKFENSVAFYYNGWKKLKDLDT